MKQKLLIYLFIITSIGLQAQEKPQLIFEELDFHDSLVSIAPDTSLMQPLTNVAALPVDTLAADSLAVEANDEKPVLEATINYNATDSIIVSLDGQKVYLYKEGKVTYENIELTADYIILDLNTKEVYAEGLADTAGVVQGAPIFKDGTDEFECKNLRYNFKSQKGIIEDVKTEQGEGYVHSERTKKVDKDAFILKNGKYTTCDADHPHFYLKMTKAKVISNKKIITGPAYMVLEDFPIYFPILPFGFFPNSPSYSSGIIIPTYGEENNRGFFLRDGGYYWAASQYFDLTMKGDIYSKGSWATYISSNYKKRYKFSGNFSAAYNINKYSEEGLPDYSKTKGFSVKWSHSQDSKANPNQSFSASVNLSTSSYDKENSTDVYSYLSSTKSSSISYSKKWENSPFSMSANITHTQNSSDSTMALSLPIMTFNMTKQYPFRAKNRSGKLKFWEKISVGYTGNIKNYVKAKEDEILQQDLVKDWQNGWQHSIPITLPSFSLLKFINFSPSFSYKERWATSKLKSHYVFNHSTMQEELLVDTVYGLKRNYDYSYALSASTTIYGMYIMKNPNSRLKAIRHKVTPSVSFSYRPDFSAAKYGFWDTYYNEKGEMKYFDRFSNSVYGNAGRGKSGSINFSLANNIEAKVAAKSDTASVDDSDEKDKYQKLKILDNLSFSGSYNLIADSLNLSTISIRGRTTIKGVSINFGGTVDPYMTNAAGTSRINQFAWNQRSGLGKLGRLTNANLSFGLNFKSKNKKDSNSGSKGAQGGQKPAGDDDFFDDEQDEMPVMTQFGPQYYDFSIPWEFSMNYSMSYSKPNPFRESTINQSVNFNGRLSLTEKWNMSMTTNFDIQAGEFSFTTFNVSRSLHCFSMSFNFVPFGQRRSYSFSLNASSSMLKDLKINKNRSWYDN
ncbi:putative LPS assembly protein LptD [Mangrovibacterium marinum]|uniref:LPS-assembly protein LptD central domain-containing protein n=1 Tax=Mangrovibacterium marinum TaxID=1639118 RepID=A0A2T5BZN5_9BACT|nr:putative LPS assembly protein LptD [Mangrovibacterium marinum]PTN07759.1 hypothetical protein C8N47_11324 [Mangrovibacterium marinum]